MPTSARSVLHLVWASRLTATKTTWEATGTSCRDLTWFTPLMLHFPILSPAVRRLLLSWHLCNWVMSWLKGWCDWSTEQLKAQAAITQMDTYCHGCTCDLGSASVWQAALPPGQCCFARNQFRSGKLEALPHHWSQKSLQLDFRHQMLPNVLTTLKEIKALSLKQSIVDLLGAESLNKGNKEGYASYTAPLPPSQIRLY